MPNSRGLAVPAVHMLEALRTRDDALRVAGPMRVDVVDGRVQPVHYLDRRVERAVLQVQAAGWLQAKRPRCAVAAVQRHARLPQSLRMHKYM